jgi:hypothetical protein
MDLALEASGRPTTLRSVSLVRKGRSQAWATFQLK